MTTQIDYIPINELAFDPENPRLPKTLRDKKALPTYEQDVIDWMLQFENVTELMGSIGEKDYFAAEPILVVKNNAGAYEVIEGNRRLTALKLLNDPSKAIKRKNIISEIISEVKFKPELIPSIKFNSRSEVLSYLGYKHITGVQSWDSLAKARYLKQLNELLPQDLEFNERCKSLAKTIGSKSGYVKLLLLGIEIYETIETKDFFGISSLEEKNFEFGVFYTALGRNNIAKYVGVDLKGSKPLENLNEEHLEDLTRWIFEKNLENTTRLGESRNLVKLNKILDSQYLPALEAFKSGRTLDESVRLTNHPSEVFENSLNESLTNLKIARDYIHELQNPSRNMEDILLEIGKISRVLRSAIQDIIIEREESQDID